VRKQKVKYLVVLAALLTAPAAAFAQTYLVPSMPQDLGNVPCGAFRKSGGGWELVGTIITGSGSKLSGGIFNAGSPEATTIEKSCGSGARKK
jgi:hypothetical protein